MKNLKTSIIRLQMLSLIYLTIALTNTVCGQVRKSEKELKFYLSQLRTSKVDTLLILKSGCIGCEIKYSDTSKAISDGQSIYVITQHNGHFNIAIFDDIHNQKIIAIDTCSIFEFVNLHKASLSQKEIFYEKKISKIKSKTGFFPPRPIHYSYENLKIHSSNFVYEFEIVDNNKDQFNLMCDKENWFITTAEIIKNVYNYLESSK
jgi:hypothetical protein